MAVNSLQVRTERGQLGFNDDFLDLGRLLRDERLSGSLHELADRQKHAAAFSIRSPVRVTGRAAGVVFGQLDPIEMIGKQADSVQLEDGKGFIGFAAGIHSGHSLAIAPGRPEEHMTVETLPELLRRCIGIHGLGGDVQVSIEGGGMRSISGLQSMGAENTVRAAGA
ncbi:hypothetical protein CF651_00080 [Paenibacillus rigui]|uniref:Uncharacterized protein n=1 Tax=Paenibacillus rigui TaxID=554312 RepID=A0A229UXT0_9BACL|nr:hypothetical protein CF651_00080 [Paenibacillus rigui]